MKRAGWESEEEASYTEDEQIELEDIVTAAKFREAQEGDEELQAIQDKVSPQAETSRAVREQDCCYEVRKDLFYQVKGETGSRFKMSR